MRKKNYFHLLFLLYFSIYAVSPLLYHYEYREAGSLNEIAAPGLRLFLVDILFSRLIRQGEQESNSSVPILLKKKRAAVSSDKVNNIEKTPIKYIGKARDLTGKPALLHIAEARNSRLQFHQDFYLYHSGLSPPVA